LNITNVIGVYNVWIQRSTTTVVILILLDLNVELCPGMKTCYYCL